MNSLTILIAILIQAKSFILHYHERKIYLKALTYPFAIYIHFDRQSNLPLIYYPHLPQRFLPIFNDRDMFEY